MIKTKIGLFGTDATITRPVLVRVVEDINMFLGFNRDIYYTLDQHETVDRAKDKLGQIESYSSPRREEVIVEYNDDMADGQDLSLINIRPDYQAIYRDDDIDAIIIPKYLKRKVTMNYKYISKSKSKITTLINMLRMLPAKDGQYVNHDLNYHYVLPTIIFELIKDINDKKNNYITTPVEIEDYINTYFDSRVDTTNASDGDSLKTDIVIRETQQSVLGYINGNIGDIKKIEVEDKSSWSIEFEYVFEYETPVELLVNYPLVVYNQLINTRFREFLPKNDFLWKGTRTGGSRPIMDLTQADMRYYFRLPKNKSYLSLPTEDQHQLGKPYPYMARLMSVLTLVNPDDKKELFNISDIPTVSFKDDILEFWKTSEYEHVGMPFKSMYYFDIYKDGVWDSENTVYMDSELNLRTSLDLDETSIYRVCINVITDINMLNTDDKKRLETYLESVAVDGAVSPIVEYYANTFNIDSADIPQYYTDYEVLTNITDNNWVRYYTVQETITLAGMLYIK